MTISNTSRIAGPFLGNGATTDFPFGFKVFSTSDMLVILTTATTGVSVEQVLNLNYYVILNADQNANPGGTIKMLTAPLTGTSLVVTSDMDVTQTLDLTNSGGFYPTVINAALDRVVILIQQLYSAISRTVRFPLSDGSSISELPPAGLRAGKLLGFDNDGNFLAVVPATSSAASLQLSLAAAGGAAGIGYVDSHDGAIASTVKQALDDRISAFRFMTSAQINSVQSGAKVIDLAPCVLAAATACAMFGKTLFLPAGTYNFLSPLPIPTNSDWVGEAGTTIYLNPGMTLGTVIGGVARAIYGDSSSNISLSKIRFASIKTGLTKATTICFNNVTRLRVQDCAFEEMGDANNYAQGLISYGGSNHRYIGNRFHNCSGDGLALSYGTTDFLIEGNEFSNNGDWGCALVVSCNSGIVQGNIFRGNASTATGVDRCSNVSFIGNTMTNNEHGIRVSQFAVTAEKNSHIIMMGNNITNVGVAGISVESMDTPGNFTIIGNVIEGSQNQGIRLIDADTGVISGNTISSSTSEGILFSANTSGKNTGTCVVSNNQISICTVGVRQITGAGVSSKITVIGNEIGPFSSAALSLVNADYVDTSNLNYVDFSKALSFPSAITASSASSGGTALPANAQGFLPIYMGGVLKKIPFYNA